MSNDMIMNKRRPARILLVEDNHGDVILTRRALQATKIANDLRVASTGEEALAMLRGEGEWANTELPDLILLDLNLPQMSGQDVLQQVKQDARFRHIPVLILSSSRSDQDVLKSYDLYANGFVVKPADLESFCDVVRRLDQFWFSLAIMPDPAARLSTR